MYENQKWVEAFRTMFKAGVTPQILSDTIDYMNNPPKNGTVLNISGPWSCVKIAIARTVQNTGPILNLRNGE